MTLGQVQVQIKRVPSRSWKGGVWLNYKWQGSK